MFCEPSTQSSTSYLAFRYASNAASVLFSFGPRFCRSVGFAGDICGLVFIYLSEKLVHTIVMSMLGMSEQEVAEGGREVSSDVIGELTNMTVGTFKNRIHDLGYPCKLTIPTVVWGADIAIQPPRGAIRRTYSFDVEGNSVIADLMFKED